MRRNRESGKEKFNKKFQLKNGRKFNLKRGWKFCLKMVENYNPKTLDSKVQEIENCKSGKPVFQKEASELTNIIFL